MMRLLRRVFLQNLRLKLIALGISFFLWATYTAEPFAQVGYSIPVAFVNVPDGLAIGGAPPYAVGALSDRRRYPRVQADVMCRPAGNPLFHHKRKSQDISLGGIRVFTDEDFPVGSRLDLDVLIADEPPVRCWATVVWRSELGAGSPARFDVGLMFSDMASSDIQRLAGVLFRAG